MTQVDPDEHSQRLAAEALAAEGSDRVVRAALRAGARRARRSCPGLAASPTRCSWSGRALAASRAEGSRALVVGSGLGDDAEHVASLGFDTVAFDVAPTAIAARRAGASPTPPVRYADRRPARSARRMARGVRLRARVHQRAGAPRAVARQGHRQRRRHGRARAGRLWSSPARARKGESGRRAAVAADPRGDRCLRRAGTLRAVRVEDLRDAGDPAYRRWRAEYGRAPRTSEPSSRAGEDLVQAARPPRPIRPGTPGRRGRPRRAA